LGKPHLRRGLSGWDAGLLQLLLLRIGIPGLPPRGLAAASVLVAAVPCGMA